MVNTFSAEFAGCATVQAVKTLMREYAKMFHPDLNPGIDDNIFKRMSSAYHDELNGRHGEETLGSDEKVHTYYYNAKTEQELLDKIAELLGCQMVGVAIELVGTWIWCSGETRENKDALKAAKLHYHGKRQMWYYRKAGRPTRYSHKSFDQLKRDYGCQSFEHQENAVATA